MSGIFSYVSIYLRDELGGTASARFYVNVGETQRLDTSCDAVRSLALLLDPLTTAVVHEIAYGAVLGAPDGAKTAPLAGSRVNEVAGFQFGQQGTPRTWTLVLPGFPRAKLRGGSPNLADSDVWALCALLAGSTLPFQYVSDHGLPLEAVRDSFFSVRKYKLPRQG